jgi:hypothetical protein
MLSNTRPSLTVFGAPTTIADQNRHLTPGEQIQHARSGPSAVLRHDDPRVQIDMIAANSMANVLSYEGMERAASRLPEGMGGESMPTKGRQAQLAILMAAREDASSGKGQWAKHADPAYGKPGRLAASMEGAGLHMYEMAQRTGDPVLKAGAMQALTVAAAAHLVGAREAALQGTNTERLSVVEAAASQRRDPLAVASDMVQLGVLPSTDPRARIKATDVDMDKTTALQRVLPVRAMPLDPTTQIDRADKVDISVTGLTIARQAEQRAVQLATMGEGGQQTANTEAAHRQLSAAFAIERMRQEGQRAKMAEQAPVAPVAEAKRRTSVFGRGER